MKRIEFKNTKNGRVLKVLSAEFADVKYSAFVSALRKKDIIVNGNRIKEDCKVQDGDIIVVYISESSIKELYSIFYQDDNLLIVNKQKGIEVCDGQNNVEQDLSEKIGKVQAVHRIDKNTSGLVVFAKNNQTFEELCSQLKNGNIKKFYLARVFGDPKAEDDMFAYLVKDSANSVVKVYNQNISGSQPIHTKYKLLEKGETSVLEVELFKGKTHQIRAHLAFVGLPIVGDGKYGDNALNRKAGKSKQCLLAYKLVFNLNKDSFLSYLNNMNFEIKSLIV